MNLKSISLRLSLMVGSALFSFTAAIAQPQADTCEHHVKDILVKKTEATASMWANLRNREGSLSFESNATFMAAKDEADRLQQPENFCPKGCRIASSAVLFFRSAPQKLLVDYDDLEHCTDLEERTSKAPLRYQTTALRTVDELNDWIGDLSQGKGDFGEALYSECDESCSPRFEYTVERQRNTTDRYLVRASIVCGGARDKDNNMYDLEAFFRWRCILNAG